MGWRARPCQPARVCQIEILKAASHGRLSIDRFCAFFPPNVLMFFLCARSSLLRRAPHGPSRLQVQLPTDGRRWTATRLPALYPLILDPNRHHPDSARVHTGSAWSHVHEWWALLRLLGSHDLITSHPRPTPPR